MTEQQMIQMCQSAQKAAADCKREVDRMKQECEGLLMEIRSLLVESKKAQEIALKNFTIDECGWVWRWNVEKQRYIKTDIHIGNMFKKDTDDILDGAVTNPKIADRAINEDKLDEDILNQVRSAGKHGYALSNEFGQSKIIGISQQKLTTEHEERVESEEDLQNQINAIITDNALLGLTANKNAIFVGEDVQVNLTATTDTDASQIKIYKGDVHLGTGSGPRSYTTTSREIPQSAGNITYRAEFTIAGLTKQITKTITAVHPVYYGAGDEYTDAQTRASVRTTPAGTYNVVVPNNGDYVFFVVPATMNINSAKMSGFDFPLQAPQNVEIEGVEYKYYQSANTYDAGTLTIVIS